MSRKIFVSVIAVAMIVLLVSLVFVSGFLCDYYNRSQADALKEELSLAYIGVQHAGLAYFDEYASDTLRFTVISCDGAVLYDSEIKNVDMDNHIDREEIRNALQSGHGSSSRYSATLTERTFYEAVLLDNGNVLRISTTQITVAALVIGMLPAICAIVLFSVAFSAVLSQKVAKSIVKPLRELDLEEPERNDTYEELTPVLSELVRQHKQIENQICELKRKTDEFGQITASLGEGLVLLDKNGTIIGMNRAAENIFRADTPYIGKSFIECERSVDMCEALNKAISGEHGEFCREKNGREYRFMISPTVSDGKILGIVILCIDVTESVTAERNRKEFTANVSHELKTPLQSIIGSAELLESGLVKKEDTEKFVGNIKNEAVRLVSLINDIIRLSQLDEQIKPPTESVDLYAEAEEVAEVLVASAAKKQVNITLHGESCTVKGVRRYVYEIIYNLCDNAVCYNKTGGKVEINVKKENGYATVEVIDTGIGIPEEHQSRIFERFYCVDKSHSKETGGTGLGLSIVKHAAVCLGAKVELKSIVNVGTTVTVRFEAI